MFNPIVPLMAFFKPIVPLVYDNTMTVYETVCKMLYKVNEMIDAYNTVLPQINNISGTTEAAREAAEYVAETKALRHILRQDSGVISHEWGSVFVDYQYYSDNTVECRWKMSVDRAISNPPTAVSIDGFTLAPTRCSIVGKRLDLANFTPFNTTLSSNVNINAVLGRLVGTTNLYSAVGGFSVHGYAAGTAANITRLAGEFTGLCVLEVEYP